MGGLRCKGRVNSVIINVITEINYRCKHASIFKIFFFFIKYNVKTCMYIISALHKFKCEYIVVKAT